MQKRKEALFRMVVGAVAVLELMCFFHEPSLSSDCEFYYIMEGKEFFSSDFPEISSLPEKARLDTGKIERPEKNKLLEYLKAELLGIAIGSEKEPIAFIKDLKTGKQKIYRQGKYIQGAKLIKIARGRVVVEKDGNTVEMFLSNHSRKRTYCEQESVSDAAIVYSGGHIVLDKHALLSQTEDIYASLRDMKVTPYEISGESIGLSVDGINGESILREAGIHNNDIIIAVNNQNVDSYQKALQVFKKVKNQKEFNVDILRNGQQKTLRYYIN